MKIKEINVQILLRLRNFISEYINKQVLCIKIGLMIFGQEKLFRTDNSLALTKMVQK